MYVCMYVCMYVYMFKYTYSCIMIDITAIVIDVIATLCDQKDIVQGHLPYGITFHKCATNEETINTASNAISENQFYVWCHLQKEKEVIRK